jgi:prolyl oligopeptidase
MRRALLSILIAALALPAIARTNHKAARSMSSPIAYPETSRVDQVDEQFGVSVADPYRWLENDVRIDPGVRDWVTAQNAVTDAYLTTLPGREIFAKRLKKLLDYERFGVPVKKGRHYFYAHNAGLRNQAVLMVRDSLDDPVGRVLIDPNGWSADGATALAEWVPSEDGGKMLYAVQDGGSDWRTVKIMDVGTGKTLSDTVQWVKFSHLAWAKDGSGFYYSRFAAPAVGAEFQALNENQQIYFHRTGTAQALDRLIYATPETPTRGHTAQVTDDGDWLVITTHEGTDSRYEITVLDLTHAEAKPRTIFRGLENQWSLAGNVGNTFYWVTNKCAPRLRIVSTDLTASTLAIHEVVPENEAVLDGAAIVGGKLLASYLVDVKRQVRRYTLDGTRESDVPLPGIGEAIGFGGDADDGETFFAFTSFATPTTIYRYDVKADALSTWAVPKVAFDPSIYEVTQRFYASKDGTRVPMFIVRRRGLPPGPAPTLLYAYGGFNISLTPSFSATRIAWLEQDGVVAVANIRGGGEYGQAWHDGGRLAHKQNAFDDFIAAAEDLIARGVTVKGQLVIQGGSNGGLLVGAVVNQRPDLFAAAIPQVGVMDMLRFDRFTAGRYWVDDYGYPAKEADFRALLAYSPYHNIRSGRPYPAILAETADTDDRVVPGHTFKYVALLQSLDLGPKPRLARIEMRAGHGSGKPTDKIIEEAADSWAFAARWTGMTVKQIR